MQDQTNLITIEESAANKVAALMQEENAQALRIFVQGGGCSGLQYGFAWEDNVNEDDFVLEKQTVKFVVDPMSMQYLQGAVIDFKEDFSGSNFVIENPNAQNTCGCGSSFTV